MADTYRTETLTETLHPLGESVIKNVPSACDVCGEEEYCHREELVVRPCTDDAHEGVEIIEGHEGRLFACGRAYAYTKGWLAFCIKPLMPRECDVCGTHNYVRELSGAEFRHIFICGRQFNEDGRARLYCDALHAENQEPRSRSTCYILTFISVFIGAIVVANLCAGFK